MADAIDQLRWLHAIGSHPTLSLGAKAVAIGLSSFWNRREGCAYPSVVTLAGRCGLSAGGVRKAVAQLRDEGFIETRRRGFRGSLSYLFRDPSVAPAASETATSKVSSGGHIEDAAKCPPGSTMDAPTCPPGDIVSALPVALNLKKEPERKKERDTPPSPSEPPRPDGRSAGRHEGGDEPAGFSDFWRQFPKRVAIGEARQEYARALERGARREDLLNGAMRYAAARDGQEERFTKTPARWLFAEAWRDDPATPAPPAARGVAGRSFSASDLAMAIATQRGFVQ